jgi:hypothetical protein
MWCEDRPLERSSPKLSGSLSSSERLCLRLFEVSDGLAPEPAVFGCSSKLVGGSWEVVVRVVGAEIVGEREAGGFGRIGPAEVTGAGEAGGISSARTNGGISSPQESGYARWRQLSRWTAAPGLRWLHSQAAMVPELQQAEEKPARGLLGASVKRGARSVVESWLMSPAGWRGRQSASVCGFSIVKPSPVADGGAGHVYE